MYRRGPGFPDQSILRIGTVDDFNIQETKLKPRTEWYTQDRMSWLPGLEVNGVKQEGAMH
jgi:hypothetical protein